MNAIYVEGACGTIMPLFDMLEHALDKGHELTMYALALVLHRLNDGVDKDAKAQEW